MGSSLGPTLANFFSGNLESSVFDHSSPSHPKIDFRHADDVFAVFDDNPAVEMEIWFDFMHATSR